VEKIHACKNNCILYRGPEYEDLERNALFVNLTSSIIEKMAVMMRAETKTEENDILVLSYHYSFEVLVCKQGVRIIAMAQREA
jgi:hypothetical protein